MYLLIMMSKYQILKDYEDYLMYIEDILGSGVTNTEPLDKLGKMLFCNQYFGAYTSGQFPHRIKNDQCFRLNTISTGSNNKTGPLIAFYKQDGKLYY